MLYNHFFIVLDGYCLNFRQTGMLYMKLRQEAPRSRFKLTHHEQFVHQDDKRIYSSSNTLLQ